MPGFHLGFNLRDIALDRTCGLLTIWVVSSVSSNSEIALKMLPVFFEHRIFGGRLGYGRSEIDHPVRCRGGCGRVGVVEIDPDRVSIENCCNGRFVCSQSRNRRRLRCPAPPE